MAQFAPIAHVGALAIGIFLRTPVNDHGLHLIGAVMTGASILGLLLLILDPQLRGRWNRR